VAVDALEWRLVVNAPYKKTEGEDVDDEAADVQ